MSVFLSSSTDFTPNCQLQNTTNNTVCWGWLWNLLRGHQSLGTFFPTSPFQRFCCSNHLRLHHNEQWQKNPTLILARGFLECFCYTWCLLVPHVPWQFSCSWCIWKSFYASKYFLARFIMVLYLTRQSICYSSFGQKQKITVFHKWMHRWHSQKAQVFAVGI